MPANPKYLTTAIHHKVTKLFSGIIGGYCISALLHMALSLWLPFHKNMLITSVYTLFLAWITFLILPFLFKNGWKALGTYTLLILLLLVAIYFGKMHYSFI
jgi:hypothetical protein